MFFILFLFSSFCENVAVSVGNNQVIFSEEKASWQAAVSYCRSIGTDWVLPSVDNQYDITVIDEGMKKINWNSVWTGIKREIFDDYYWEDGTLDGTLDVSNVSETNSSKYCVSVRRDSLRYENVDCYALGVLGICLIDTCNCSAKTHIDNCLPRGTACYVWPHTSRSWFSSRNWCFRMGGHLMNKSNIEQYKHPEGTSINFFWTGLRRADWVIYNEKKAKKHKALSVNYWEDNEPLEGNGCVVLSGSLWKSRSCESQEHFVCVGSANNSLELNHKLSTGLGSANNSLELSHQLSTGLEISNSTQNVDIKVDQTTELHGSGSGSRSGSGIFLPITLGLSLTILIVLIMTITYLSCRHLNCKEVSEYAEVQVDQMESSRHSPSNRPPVPIPQSEIDNSEAQLYSTPLTEEDILRMVMASVSKQLGEASKMPAIKRRSFIRSAAKCFVEDYLEPVIDESGSGQMVLKKGKTLNKEKDTKLSPVSVSYKVPVPIQDQLDPSSQDSEPGPSSQDCHTEAELDEARDILSEILSDIFTTRKGNVTITVSLGESTD